MVTMLVKLFWAARNVKVLLEGGNCGGIGNFVVFPILFQLLGDGLCWVYNPPIRLYDELSIFDLHSFSTHFLFTARYFLHTHVAHARALTSSL